MFRQLWRGIFPNPAQTNASFHEAILNRPTSCRRNNRAEGAGGGIDMRPGASRLRLGVLLGPSLDLALPSIVGATATRDLASHRRAAIAREPTARKARVVLSGRDQAALEAVAAGTRAKGGEVDQPMRPTDAVRFLRENSRPQRQSRAQHQVNAPPPCVAICQRTAANSAPMPLNSSNILPAGAGAAGCGAASSTSRSASASLI
jgi:hypothetical protein